MLHHTMNHLQQLRQVLDAYKAQLNQMELMMSDLEAMISNMLHATSVTDDAFGQGADNLRFVDHTAALAVTAPLAQSRTA